MTEFKYMDKETWIASRTDNPNKLGKEVWERMYDGVFQQKPTGISSETSKKMAEEFISKYGLSCDLADSAQLETAKYLMETITDDEGQARENFQDCLDKVAALSKKEKSHSTVRDTLKKGLQGNMEALRNNQKGGIE